MAVSGPNGMNAQDHFKAEGANASGADVQGSFVEEDVRLPWLEPEDEDPEASKPDNRQLVILGAVGLAALFLILGGIYWVTRAASDEVIVADGGIIKSPEKPYKVQPENPGGKVFAGTGDSAFPVSEGQTRPIRLDTSGTAVPANPAPVTEAGQPAGQGAATPSASQGLTGSQVAVQVGAYSAMAQAEAGWKSLQTRSSLLKDVGYRIEEGRADIGTVYRLQAVAPDAAAANTLCNRLKSAGIACQVKR